MTVRIDRQRRLFRLPLLLVLALAAISPAAPVHAQESDAEPSAQQRLSAAVEQLTAEAEALDEFGDDHPELHFRRPHPSMEDWSTDLALPTLNRMQQRFTGNDYRDTYIRWHLLWIVKNLMRESLDRYVETGTHQMPAEVPQQLMTLVREMPGPLQRERRPEVQRVPEELWNEYYKLRSQATVRIGYPPFERLYRWEEALPHASGERRAQVQAAIEQAEKIRPRLQTNVDEEARAYNGRIRRVNLIVRQYRGELIYGLIQTGDDQLLPRAVEEIDRQVRDHQWAALDLMRYMYLAAFDGYLMLYQPATYQRTAEQLKRTAQRADEYRVYRFGDKEPPSTYRPKHRNFADYAFHMVHLLQDPEALRWFHQQVSARKKPPEPTHGEDFQYTPYNFTMKDVQVARERAIHRLYHPGSPNLRQRLLPQFDLSRDRMDALRHIRRQSQRYQELVHEFGNQALVSWALMAGGESFQDPRLFQRINWALVSDTPFTFDRGMRLQMLAQMPYERWQPWVNRDVRWLTNALSDKGNWDYQYTGGNNTSWGDHANGAYGVLGLWGAQQAGMEISLAAWEAIDQHWRMTQQSTADDRPAGWAVNMLNVEDEGADEDGFRSRVSGPMTAAGVATLTLTERFIYGAQRTDPDEENVSTHLQKGIDWLDQNFTLDDSDPSANWFYYMWTIQRVGQATGYRTFNGIDWFRDVTAEILNRQQPNGLWEDPTGQQGPLVSTGFALLYLGNARAPIAISKIRFDGEWNNRPHDLWNFVEYASDQYEVESGWQIVEADQPVYQLIESPLLYLATDEAFELTQEQIDRLREYIHAGGLLVLNPDQADAGAARSFNQLTEQLFPDLQMQDVPDDHAFYHIHEPLQPSVRMKMMHNGVRPLLVQFVRDIGEGLQANQIGRSGSFTALNNLYLHSVSLNPRRSRLGRHYVVPNQRHARNLSRSIEVVRLRHGGTYDPEPLALPQLKALMARDHDMNVQIQTIDPAALSDEPVALLTTIGDAELSDPQVQAIRGWLERGGTLWIDAAGGSQEAAQDAKALLERIAPDNTPTRLTSDSPIISGQDLPGGFNNRRIEFRYYALREMGPVTRPRLQTVRINDRPAIIYSPEDLTTGLAGIEQWGLFGYTIDSARQLLANSLLHALQGDPTETAAR